MITPAISSRISRETTNTVEIISAEIIQVPLENEYH
jgi:hypothetical protein